LDLINKYLFGNTINLIPGDMDELLHSNSELQACRISSLGGNGRFPPISAD